MSSDSTHKLWQVLDNINLALLLYDNKNDSFYVNAAACALFELKHCKALKESDFNPITLLTIENNKHISVKSLFATQTCQYILLKKQQISLALNATFSQLSDSLAMFSFEQLKSTEVELYNFDRVISGISSELIDIQNNDIDPHIDLALEAIARVCRADRSYLFEFNIDNETITNTHEWVGDGVVAFKDELQAVPKHDLPYFFDVMNATQVFKVSDVAKLPAAANAEKTLFQQQDILSLLCVGLRFDKQLIGFIGCECINFKRNWSQIDLVRIKLVADIIASALKNINYKNKLQQTQQQLITANQRLSKLVNTDGLTNIANRRCFDNALKSEIQRCARNNQPISLIMCDIDHFKRYNDAYGHPQGDEALKLVAQTLSSCCKREGDLAARYGGEEFAIILPGVNAQQCHQFATLLQQQINELAIEHNASSVANILTLSLGCDTVYPDKTTHSENIITNADAALYQAKETGRNQICQFLTD